MWIADSAAFRDLIGDDDHASGRCLCFGLTAALNDNQYPFISLSFIAIRKTRSEIKHI
jgi:hypothetical protein